MARRLLSSERSLDRGVFSPRVLRDASLGAGDLLAMLNVEVWFRVFIDRDPVQPTERGALTQIYQGGVTFELVASRLDTGA